MSNPNQPALRWSLLLPGVFAIGQAVALAIAFKPLARMRKDMGDAATLLGYTAGTPSVQPLRTMMYVFLALNVATIIGLLVVAIYPAAAGLSVQPAPVATSTTTATTTTATPTHPTSSMQAAPPTPRRARRPCPRPPRHRHRSRPPRLLARP